MHDQNWCPEVECKDCGEKGHTQYVCPKAICYRCTQQGHKAYNCKEKREARGERREARGERREGTSSGGSGKRRASDLLKEFKEFDAEAVERDLQRQISKAEKELGDLEFYYMRERKRLEARRWVLIADLDDHRKETAQIVKLQRMMAQEEEEQSEAALLGEEEREGEEKAKEEMDSEEAHSKAKHD